MLQPFEVFKPLYLNKLVQLQKHFLVTQTYQRGHDPFEQGPKTPILLSDYSDEGLAKIHLGALKEDRYAALVDLRRAEHRQKILDMLSPASSYRLFWAVVTSTKELEARINERYKDHMRRYIEQNTSWRIGRNTTLRPSIQQIFGELFIILKYSSETLRITFEQLENA